MAEKQSPNISSKLKVRILREDSQAFSKALPSVKHVRLIIREVIFGVETRWGKGFDVLLLWAIVLSLIAIMLESVLAIRLEYGVLLYSFEWAFTLFFTLEYGLRLWVSERPKKYALSFLGIIDLLAIVPTYLSLFIVGSQFLLVIRAIRLMRVFRVLKLMRYLSGARLLVNALRASKEKIFVFISAVLTAVVIFGTLIYLIEGGENGFDSIPRSIYWAIVTLTTVGYGDIVPVTVAGQFLAAFIMIMGYGIIAVPTGIVGAEMARSGRTGNAKNCHRCEETQHIVASRYCHKCGEKMAKPVACSDIES